MNLQLSTTQDYYMCALWLYYEKYFAGNFSLTKVNKKHSFEASKVVEKSLIDIHYNTKTYFDKN